MYHWCLGVDKLFTGLFSLLHILESIIRPDLLVAFLMLIGIFLGILSGYRNWIFSIQTSLVEDF